ncbi:MAG: phosphomannomutase [Pikeienuella sp.]
MTELTCFKSYDVRGQLGVNLDESIARRIGRGFAEALGPKMVVCGRDCRESSAALQTALIDGLTAMGVDVIDIGLCGTEEVYFATSHYQAGGGLMVTASHNPIDYNGIKMVGEGSTPLAGDSGLAVIKAAAEGDGPAPAETPGKRIEKDPRAAYAAHVAGMVDLGALGPMKILVNAGNGVAGPAFDAICETLADTPLTFEQMYMTPDGTFPNGIPNPLLVENRAVTADAVRAAGADMGVAWDGDFDRCFFFDETGAFVDGEYIVGLLATAFLQKEAGARIVYDPRVVLNTEAIIAEFGGGAVMSRTGHSFIKADMRKADAAYGGEISAHHYFRDFMYCDSGMIPWLLVAEVISKTGKPLSALIADMKAAYPSSGEINFKIEDKVGAIAAIEAEYLPKADAVTRIDGVSLTYPEWRVNVRSSNTEPVLRLNVETRGDAALLAEKVAEITAIIEARI